MGDGNNNNIRHGTPFLGGEYQDLAGLCFGGHVAHEVR
jgi:hypothetical protein